MKLLGNVDCVVVGAGVIGLACARALAANGREVLVLEAEARLGAHASGRNSEVIHAGIYYAPGSLKARLCVAGRELLYRYLAQYKIPHRRLGKIIVATSVAELDLLHRYLEHAHANGVHDLQCLDSAQIRRLEPALRGEGGLLSPATGILDSHAYLLALQGDLEADGGTVAVRARAQRCHLAQRGFELEVMQGEEQYRLRCRILVNATGLNAQSLARTMGGFPRNKIPPGYYARGHYMTYSGSSPFKRLIYPVAGAGGLGIHLTLDLAGQARFGPDVEWVDEPSYEFGADLQQTFADAIRAYWPGVEPSRLQPAYVGVRPKLAGSGQSTADFMIQGPGQHGVAGLVHLYGIESPGLTASLAIGDYVRHCLEQ